MLKDVDWWTLAEGKKQEELTRLPTLSQVVRLAEKQLASQYPLISLGTTSEGELLISEEERVSHTHIIGTTNEGKSKFLEYLIRHDIQTGNGVCLLDPTDNAETAYKVLRYCAKIGFNKVCLIDPHTLASHNRITAIQPFIYKKSYKNAVVANLMDTVRILFNTKDAAETPRIQRYLPAILYCLYNAEMTLHEAIYFSEYKHSVGRRNAILGASDPLDRHRLALEEAFATYHRFDTQISSTVRRLEPFFDSTLDLMFGADHGVNFLKMIVEGWVILVNLHDEGGVETIHTRLLGTMVINELLFAMYRLRQRGYSKPYYLYIDEAGQYINNKLIRLMEVKRHSGFRITIAHQGFFQFPKDKATAVKQLTKLKIMFNTPDYGDRLEMIKALGYGGDIPPLLASYANADLPKQYAVIKKGKESPVRVRIPDVPDIKLDKKVETDFINKTLLNEWNYSPDQVREQMENRFYDAKPPVRPTPPRKGATTNRPSTGGTQKPKPKTIFDD